MCYSYTFNSFTFQGVFICFGLVDPQNQKLLRGITNMSFQMMKTDLGWRRFVYIPTDSFTRHRRFPKCLKNRIVFIPCVPSLQSPPHLTGLFICYMRCSKFGDTITQIVIYMFLIITLRYNVKFNKTN